MTTTATRELDGIELPAPGTWEIDPAHAEVALTGRHFMVTKVRGRFTDVTGTVTVADDMSRSSVDVVIGMASVQSGNAARDEHLRSAELFDVASHPTGTFRSVHVDWQGAGGVVLGDLTVHGVTRRVLLQVSFGGHVRDPWGSDRAVFSAEAKINREDFDITWNMALETGGVLVGKDITIHIEIETVLSA